MGIKDYPWVITVGTVMHRGCLSRATLALSMSRTPGLLKSGRQAQIDLELSR